MSGKNKITNRRVIDLLIGLGNVKDISGADIIFSIAVVINTRMLKPVVKTIQEFVTPSSEYMKYEKLKLEIARKYAQRNEKNEPVVSMVAGVPQFIIKDEHIDITNEEIEILKTSSEFKQIVEKQEAREKEYEKLLDSPAEKVNLHLIDRDKLPTKEIQCPKCKTKIVTQSLLTPAQLEGIFDILK